jgi:hypothetical protein
MIVRARLAYRRPPFSFIVGGPGCVGLVGFDMLDMPGTFPTTGINEGAWDFCFHLAPLSCSQNKERSEVALKATSLCKPQVGCHRLHGPREGTSDNKSATQSVHMNIEPRQRWRLLYAHFYRRSCFPSADRTCSSTAAFDELRRSRAVRTPATPLILPKQMKHVLQSQWEPMRGKFHHGTSWRKICGYVTRRSTK